MTNNSSMWSPTVNSVDEELRAILKGKAVPEEGAGYVAYDDGLLYQAGSVGGAIKQMREDVTNLTVETTTGFSTFLKYGGNGDGVTLNDDAFAAALLDTDRLYVPNPAVCYLISQPIAITASNIKILGESRLLTKIKINNSSLPVFIVAPNLQNVELNTLKLERTVPATATGTGVEISGPSTSHVMRDLDVEGHWNGMILGGTESGQVVNCNVFNCYGNGIKQISGAAPFLTWAIRDSRVYNNNGNGIDIEAEGTAVDVTLGTIDNVYSVYNTGYGIDVRGFPLKKVNSLRITGGAFSLNGNTGIRFDTYGARHRISDASCNLQGTALTGINRATAATSQGNGLQVTANNLELNIVGCIASENSYSGMDVEGSLLAIVGNTCTDNGKNIAAATEQRSGIRAATGQALIQGNAITNRVSGAGTQQHGVHITNGVNCIIDGNNCAGNMVGAVTISGSSSTNRITNNAGYNPHPMDTVALGASPWTYTAGNSPETLFIKGGTFTLLVSEGVTIATAAVTATQYHNLPLEPNQSFTLTYSAAPTILRKRK